MITATCGSSARERLAVGPGDHAVDQEVPRASQASWVGARPRTFVGRIRDVAGEPALAPSSTSALICWWACMRGGVVLEVEDAGGDQVAAVG